MFLREISLIKPDSLGQTILQPMEMFHLTPESQNSHRYSTHAPPLLTLAAGLHVGPEKQ